MAEFAVVVIKEILRYCFVYEKYFIDMFFNNLNNKSKNNFFILRLTSIIRMKIGAFFVST